MLAAIVCWEDDGEINSLACFWDTGLFFCFLFFQYIDKIDTAGSVMMKPQVLSLSVSRGHA